MRVGNAVPFSIKFPISSCSCDTHIAAHDTGALGSPASGATSPLKYVWIGSTPLQKMNSPVIGNVTPTTCFFAVRSPAPKAPRANAAPTSAARPGGIAAVSVTSVPEIDCIVVISCVPSSSISPTNSPGTSPVTEFRLTVCVLDGYAAVVVYACTFVTTCHCSTDGAQRYSVFVVIS